jgi:hypothetical protein
MSTVHLHIDRIVLRGVDAADRQALVQGLQAELARVLADPKTRAGMTTSRHVPVLRLGRMTMTPGNAGARSFGAGVARAIGKGMKP